MNGFDLCHRQLNSLGIKARAGVSLASYTTFRIGGPAALLVEPTDQAQLMCALRTVRQVQLPYFVLGRGSNLLVPDEGLPCVVIRTCGVNAVQTEGVTMVAELGATLFELSRVAKEHGLSGLEFSHGIPGTLGGALFMNAGAYGGEMAQVVKTVKWYDVERDECICAEAEALSFGYRFSSLQAHPERVALSACLELTPADPSAIEAQMQDYMARRREKQPLEYPSAGSAFKRPAGAYAGQLIEQSGLKGYRIGGAQVSTKHAGFIINVGGATARDVLALIEHVRSVVLRDHGIDLESEIQLLTFPMAK